MCSSFYDFDNISTLDFDYDMENIEVVDLDTRFGSPLGNENVTELEKSTIPKGSLNSAKWAKNVFNDWVYERNNSLLNSSDADKLLFLSETSSDGHEKLEFISKNTLNETLKFFFHEVRNKKGDRYPPETLRLLMSGIQRYIKLERSIEWKVSSCCFSCSCCCKISSN